MKKRISTEDKKMRLPRQKVQQMEIFQTTFKPQNISDFQMGTNDQYTTTMVRRTLVPFMSYRTE